MTSVQMGLRFSRPLARLSILVVLSLLLLASAAQAQWQADRGLVIVGTVVTMNDAGDVLSNVRVFLRDKRNPGATRSQPATKQ